MNALRILVLKPNLVLNYESRSFYVMILLLQKYRYIVSDCDAVATIYEYHNYSKSPEEAVALALKAGLVFKLFVLFYLVITAYFIFFGKKVILNRESRDPSSKHVR